MDIYVDEKISFLEIINTDSYVDLIAIRLFEQEETDWANIVCF